MNPSRTTNLLLLIIAAALLAIAFKPVARPTSVQAQSTSATSWYVEPGVRMLRSPDGGQVLGKVAVDLRTGNAWGFPTYNNEPYPISQSVGGKGLSHPFLLGRFAVEEANK